MATKDIAVFVGSLRKEAFSLKLAKALQKLSPEGLKLDIVEIGHLGFYNQDLDANPPAVWTEFRERVRRADGVLLITPEYNRSVPAGCGAQHHAGTARCIRCKSPLAPVASVLERFDLTAARNIPERSRQTVRRSRRANRSTNERVPDKLSASVQRLGDEDRRVRLSG
jgi:hypothetical protein